MTFNHQERKRNIVRSSVAAGACNALSMVLGFAYRMVFLHVLSVQYLGINSLFTNVLGVLSLAELGVGNAIVFRLYGPISSDDVDAVGKLMRFFRRAYHVVGAVILLLGLCLMPFVDAFVRDAGEVPVDVNLHLVFALFVAQSGSSYLFSYRLALLEADQRGYAASALGTGVDLLRYVVQMALLLLTGNYTLTLSSGIVMSVLLNWCASRWVTRRYAQVFRVVDDISPDERRGIFADTSAVMLHKVGGVVLGATDSILLSRFEGFAVTGVYSNYQLVLSGATRVVSVLFSSFTASLGNAHVELPPNERHAFYRKALFANLAAVGAFTSCMYVLMDDFITLWLGEGMLLDRLTLTCLCVQFYELGARQVTDAYVNASGLIVKDRIRPLIEAALNVVVSVVALRFIGVAGVVVGTIVSCALTAVWREPYLLYRYAFGRSVWEYWRAYALHVTVTIVAGVLLWALRSAVAGPQVGLLAWLALGTAGIAVYAAVLTLAFFRTEEYRYYVGLLRGLVAKALAGRSTIV